MSLPSGVYGNRIIGGAEAKPNSIKYQASLTSFDHHFCGGTLIQPQWVVSAAHCWMWPEMITVVLSDHNIKKWDGSEQYFNVTKIIKHNGYRHWTFDNDIMLLKLDRPAILNDKVQLVTLPDYQRDPLPPSTKCTVSGWGVPQVNSPSLAPTLRFVDVYIIPSCWLYYYFRITDNMICAGAAFKDACQVREIANTQITEIVLMMEKKLSLNDTMRKVHSPSHLSW
ncbi:hypothetical protein LDENG_00021400 [Lucifuga dentata]|nr:hypothetical protein LDENG_00021400 [Lucifuga dentata]